MKEIYCNRRPKLIANKYEVEIADNVPSLSDVYINFRGSLDIWKLGYISSVQLNFGKQCVIQAFFWGSVQCWEWAQPNMQPSFV